MTEEERDLLSDMMDALIVDDIDKAIDIFEQYSKAKADGITDKKGQSVQDDFEF